MSRSASFRVGLVLLGSLSVFDLMLPLATDGQQPPMAVALGAAALGTASLVLVISAWRGAWRAVPALMVLRVLSALSAVPAFFAPGVDVPTRAAAGAVVILTVVGVLMVATARSTQRVADSR